MHSWIEVKLPKFSKPIYLADDEVDWLEDDATRARWYEDNWSKEMPLGLFLAYGNTQGFHMRFATFRNYNYKSGFFYMGKLRLMERSHEFDTTYVTNGWVGALKSIGCDEAYAKEVAAYTIKHKAKQIIAKFEEDDSPFGEMIRGARDSTDIFQEIADDRARLMNRVRRRQAKLRAKMDVDISTTKENLPS